MSLQASRTGDSVASVPAVHRWRLRLRLHLVCAALLEPERGVLRQAPADRAPHQARLDAIDQGADALELPLSFGDQLQVLREHLALVRRRPSELGGPAGSSSPSRMVASRFSPFAAGPPAASS